ncbi:MAG TPA: phosphotransferase family protein [Jatrophihabitantaceae bacterium]|nr:phosphotransferase family protein [Jatrophihabitantaceae bacterium]
MTELPGLDLGRVAAWMDRELPDVRTGELDADIIQGGKSNLTYRVTDGQHVWALRRPPLGHVLPTAHDMSREYRVISALDGSDVPVASAVGLCTDLDVLGAPFYLMSYVDGVVFDRADALAALDRDSARRLGEVLIDTLVALHHVDPDQVGLGDFGRPAGFLERQVGRWHKQWQASETRPLPELGKVVDALRARLPESAAPGVVHGDYRLTNVIYAADLTRIAAVVDWEMATLGDPLTDVGLLVVYHQLAEQQELTMPMMRPADGFLSADQLAARYAASSGRSVDELGWYVAFGYYKLAVIAEGIAARHLQGKTVGAGYERFGSVVPALLTEALATLEAS